MDCLPQNQAVRLFRRRSYASAALVILFAFVAAASFRLLHLHGILAWFVAVLPALPILWALVAVGQYSLKRRTSSSGRCTCNTCFVASAAHWP